MAICGRLAQQSVQQQLEAHKARIGQPVGAGQEGEGEHGGGDQMVDQGAGTTARGARVGAVPVGENRKKLIKSYVYT